MPGDESAHFFLGTKKTSAGDGDAGDGDASDSLMRAELKH